MALTTPDQTPSVGRIVHYNTSLTEGSGVRTVMAAIVTHVWNGSVLNLSVFASDGIRFITSVPYFNNEHAVPTQSNAFWTYPPRV